MTEERTLAQHVGASETEAAATRDRAAHDRDRAADARDRVADARDVDADERDSDVAEHVDMVRLVLDAALERDLQAERRDRAAEARDIEADKAPLSRPRPWPLGSAGCRPWTPSTLASIVTSARETAMTCCTPATRRPHVRGRLPITGRTAPSSASSPRLTAPMPGATASTTD